jgi:hypothetical protein
MNRPELSSERAVALVEGREEGTNEEVLAAWQTLTDSGVVWTLPGPYGQLADALLAEGVLLPPQQRERRRLTHWMEIGCPNTTD